MGDLYSSLTDISNVLRYPSNSSTSARSRSERTDVSISNSTEKVGNGDCRPIRRILLPATGSMQFRHTGHFKAGRSRQISPGAVLQMQQSCFFTAQSPANEKAQASAISSNVVPRERSLCLDE